MPARQAAPSRLDDGRVGRPGVAGLTAPAPPPPAVRCPRGSACGAASVEPSAHLVPVVRGWTRSDGRRERRPSVRGEASSLKGSNHDTAPRLPHVPAVAPSLRDRAASNTSARTASPRPSSFPCGYAIEDPLRPVEVFYAEGFRSGADLEFLTQDACVLVSLLLQHGVPPRASPPPCPPAKIPTAGTCPAPSPEPSPPNSPSRPLGRCPRRRTQRLTHQRSPDRKDCQ